MKKDNTEGRLDAHLTSIALHNDERKKEREREREREKKKKKKKKHIYRDYIISQNVCGTRASERESERNKKY